MDANPVARKWVLVVDDDFHVREAWLAVLQQAGYAAVGAEDGLTAAELIRDLVPDLIILDLRMRRMSGWDFLDVARAHPPWRRIPILVVSGYLSETPTLDHAQLNIVGQLAKPVGAPELLEKIHEAIGPARPAPRPAPGS